MSRGRHAFKQNDLTRAIKALARSGARGRVEVSIDNRKIVVVITDEIQDKPSEDDWD